MEQLALKHQKALLYGFGGILVLCLGLLVSGHGVLVGEKRTHAVPYAPRTVVRIGNVDVPGELMGTTYFQCSYFTGRGVVTILVDAHDGYNQCPFLKRV